ncbi:uncharacterized protein BDR25DRAFT_245734, partial [Lindgomyces ingoldianus]
LKAALWYAIGQYVDEECLQKNLNATPQFIGALTELVYTQILNTSRDLEMFSKHAGRKVINMDDVLLLGRRNDALLEILGKKMQHLRAEEGRTGVGEGKARGRPPGKGTSRGKGMAKQ